MEVSELWRYEIPDFTDQFADAGGDTYIYLWKDPSTTEQLETVLRSAGFTEVNAVHHPKKPRITLIAKKYLILIVKNA